MKTIKLFALLLFCYLCSCSIPETIKRLNKKVYQMMAKNCSQPKNYFLDIIHSKGHADWYIEAREAKKHNLEGIDHWNQGHYDVALKHFNKASQSDPSSGEVHFNEAISYDKVGQHGVATKHFKVALKKAGGNEKILKSPILHGHIGM